MPEPQISVVTGLPLDGSPTLDPETNLPNVSAVTGLPFSPSGPTSRMGTHYDPIQGIMGTEKSMGYSEDIEKYQEYGVPLGRNLDWNELRARNQSTAEQWGRGLAKAGVTTLGAIAENTLGVVAGIGQLTMGSGNYYDNFIGKAIDSTNEWMRENMPNYQTEAERNMGTLQKMGTANFWADTVANGLGYSLGSIATMYLTGGVGVIGALGKTAKVGKGLSALRAAKAITTGGKLGTKIAAGAKGADRLRRAAQMTDAAILMSLAESSVEARETQNSVWNDLTQGYMEENNLRWEREIPEDIRQDFKKASMAAGNTNFGLNMVVTSGTNALMFGKMALGFKGAAKTSADVAWDSAKRNALNKLAERSVWQKAISKMKPIAEGGLEEAAQEGLQFASNIYSSKYHTDKYHDGGIGDRWSAMTKGLGETFGTQEGRESMLVGFLTGGLMGGGGAVINKPYKTREKNAALLTKLINTGYFEGPVTAGMSENAYVAAQKRMASALEAGDHKSFKDAQFEFIAANALQTLEHGGFDVLMEKLEDSKTLDADQFMEFYGYQNVDSSGNQITLADQTTTSEHKNGQTQAQIVDNLKNKLASMQQTYEKVNEMFPLKDKTKGLPRMRMSEEQRTAEDNVYRRQQALRQELILKGALVNDRGARIESIEKGLQELIDNDPILKEAGIDVKNALKEAFTENDVTIDENTPDAESYLQKRQNAQLDALNEVYKQIQKLSPSAAAEYLRLATDHAALTLDTNQALNSYNKLASDPWYQKAFQEEVERSQNIQKQRVITKQVDDSIKNSETVADLEKNSPAPDQLSDADKAKLVARKLELEKQETTAGRKFLDDRAGMSLEDRLKDLKTIDREGLSALEQAGLQRAIKLTEDLIAEQKAAQAGETSAQERAENMQDEGLLDEVEEELSAEKLGDVELIDAEGREFQIDGKKFYNHELNPLDAIQRTREGRILKIRLTDEYGNRQVIWGPKARVDAIAYAITMSEVLKVEGQPTLEKDQLLREAKIAKEEIKRKATTGKHGIKTTESLRQEVYELERLLEAALEAHDNLRTSYIQEAGATKEDLKNDPELQELAKSVRSLRAQMRERIKILKLRQEPIVATDSEILKAENKASDTITEHENNISSLENDIASSEQDIADANARVEALNAASMAEKATDDWISARREAKDTILTSEQLIAETNEKIKDLRAKIALEEKTLKRLENEKAANITRDREDAELSDATQIEGEESRREATDPRERVKEERADVEAQKADIEERRQAELKEKSIELEDVTFDDEGRAEPTYKNRPVVELSNVEFEDDGTPVPTYVEASWVAEINAKYDAELAALEEQSPEELQTAPEDNEGLKIEQALTNEPASAEDTEAVPGQPMDGEQLSMFEDEDSWENVDPDAPTFGEALETAAGPTTTPTPTGKTLGVRKANDDNVVNLAPDTKHGDYVIPVSELGVVDKGDVDTVNGEAIVMNRDRLSRAGIGTPVEFEIIENDWFIEKYGGLVDKDGTVYWQDVPIYIKIDGEVVGKLEANNSSDRLAIVEKLRAGEPVVTTISNIQSSANNYNHTRVFAEGNVVAPYFSDPREVFQESDEGSIVLAAVKKDRRVQSWTTGFEIPWAESIDAELSSHQNFANIKSGQIAIVIRPEDSPDGKSKLTMASTATLSPSTQDTVIEKLKNGEISDVAEIVANSKTDDAAARAEDSYLSLGEFSDGKAYMIYKSPATGMLVRINADELSKGLNNKPSKYQFVKFNEDEGKFVGVQAPAAFEQLDKAGINNDVTAFLGNKKYNVDIEMANMDMEYKSKITGQDYPSYQAYIFAEGETGNIEGRFGRSAILTTDMKRVNGSLFNNLGVEFDKGDIVGATLEETVAKTETISAAPGGGISVYNRNELDALLGETEARDISNDQLNQDCK